MRRLGLPVGTVTALLAEVGRGPLRDGGVFAGMRRERVEVYQEGDIRLGARAASCSAPRARARSKRSTRSSSRSLTLPTVGSSTLSTRET